MLTWLLALSFLSFGGFASAALEATAGKTPESAIIKGLKVSTLLDTFQDMQLGDLEQIFCTPNSLYEVVDEIIKDLYSTEHSGNKLLNYTKILRELDIVVQDAAQGRNVAEANTILQSSSHFKCLRLILEAQFGYCIHYSAETLPKFSFHNARLSILSDERRVSVLPYVLDQMKYNGSWVYFIRGLVGIKRVDLLEQITFANISSDMFFEVLGVALPQAARMTAAKSLHRKEPALQLPELLTVAGLESETAPVFESRTVALPHLYYFFKNKIEFPKNCMLVAGLHEFSFQFWLKLFKSTPEKVLQVLDLVFRYGDSTTRRVADMFLGPVSVYDLDHSQGDVYQALLTFFRFSSLCNANILANYSSVFGAPTLLGHQTILALIVHEQLAIVEEYPFLIHDFALEPLIVKLFQLKDTKLDAILWKCLQHYNYAPQMLKDLVKRNTEDPHAQLVWEAIQYTVRPREIPHLSCSAPLSTLRLIMFEKDVSVNQVQSLLGTLGGFSGWGAHITKDAHVLYTLVFWEASETVLGYFLDQLPKGCALDLESVWNVLKIKKYSADFCISLISRIGKRHALQMREEVLKLRPDLGHRVSLLAQPERF